MRVEDENVLGDSKGTRGKERERFTKEDVR